jgi:uncharacterized protein (DUF362 family)
MIQFHRETDYANLKLENIPQEFWKYFPDCRGYKVFVKPNLVAPPTKWDIASCTRVEVVSLVIEYLIENGANSIVVGDCGFKDQWEHTIKISRYDQLPKKYGVELIGLQEGPNFHDFTLMRKDDYLSLFGAKFSNHMLDCDFVVNIPKLKVHYMALVTGAIKNMMGTMTQKGSMHPRASSEVLHKRLHDLYFLIKERVAVCVMDGIEGSEYAEQYGIAKKANILTSTDDMWNMDVAAAIIMGIPPESVKYLDYIRNSPKLDVTRNSIKRNFSEIVVPPDLVVPFERPLGHLPGRPNEIYLR